MDLTIHSISLITFIVVYLLPFVAVTYDVMKGKANPSWMLVVLPLSVIGFIIYSNVIYRQQRRYFEEQSS